MQNFENEELDVGGVTHENGSESELTQKLLTETKKIKKNITKVIKTISTNLGGGGDDVLHHPTINPEVQMAEQKEAAAAVHGSLRCMLPLMDETSQEKQENLNEGIEIDGPESGAESSITANGSSKGLRTQTSSKSQVSPRPYAIESEDVSGVFSTDNVLKRGDSFKSAISRNYSSEKELDYLKYPKPMLTPGEIRFNVLEWLYEERDVPCEELNLDNLTVLTDLVEPLVSVLLHGKSEYIRTHIWRYLLSCCSISTHFAFLTICALNASQIVTESSSAEAETHKTDADEIDELMSKTLKSLKGNVERLENDSGNKNAKLIEKIKGEVDLTIGHLQKVHQKLVLRHIDQGPTARANIDFLINRIRASMAGKDNQLDGKLGFIKTLTDLDEWLIRSVGRSDRLAVLKEKLETLSIALPLGAYFPVSVNSAWEDHKVLRLVLDETIVFNTARKCPYLIVAEIETTYPERLKQTVHDAYSINKNSYEKDSDAESEFGSPPPSRLRSLEMVLTRTPSNLTAIEDCDKDHHDVQQELLHDDRISDSEGVNITNEYEEANQTERWEDMVSRIRAESPYGERPNWNLAAMFVKAGDDLRQQQLGVLLVSTFQKIFWEEKVLVKLFPYKVIATGPSSGLLEPAKNADSIARIKERGGYQGIDEYFRDKFGNEESFTYKTAQRNFTASLAGYSVVAYLIKLHDRHNGNILISTEGHLMHIDFGFMLGHSHKLELSPFKLTPDMVNILGGPRSVVFQRFRRLMEKAYIAANKHYKEIVLLLELMSVGSPSDCFAGGRRWVIDELRERFNPGLPKRKLKKVINDLIDYSMGNYTSRCYDKYQRCANGIF